jgi:hypothetical protein
MMAAKTIGFVFIEGFADWEFGLLSGSAPEWFGARCIALTPERRPVVSIGGFQLAGQRGLTPEEKHRSRWGGGDRVGWLAGRGRSGPGAAPALGRGARRGRGRDLRRHARAGARQPLPHRAHTSNGRDWILHHLPDYAGAEHYRDVPHAVADCRLISAPGSAPGTFAIAFLEALYPDRPEPIAQMRAMLAGEYGTAGGAG